MSIVYMYLKTARDGSRPLAQATVEGLYTVEVGISRFPESTMKRENKVSQRPATSSVKHCTV